MMPFNPQLKWTSSLVLFSLLAIAVLLPACTLGGQRVGNYQIVGRVTDPYGKPLEGAVVQFRWGNEFEPLAARGIRGIKVHSDEAGKFLYEQSAAYRADFWLIPPLGNLLSSKNPALTVAFAVMHEDYSVGWFILQDEELHKLFKVTDPKGGGEPDLYEGFTFEKSEKKPVKVEKEEQGRKYDLGDVTLEAAAIVM